MKPLAMTTVPPATASPAGNVPAVRGALLLAFGLLEGALTLALPHITVTALVLVMAGFVFVDAVTALVEAARARGRSPWLVPHALAGVAAGVLLLRLPAGRSVTVFAWWAMVTGVLAAVESLATGSARPVRFVVAALSLALGLVVVGGAARDPVRALLAISVYGVIAGGLQLAGARSTRTRPAGAQGR